MEQSSFIYRCIYEMYGITKENSSTFYRDMFRLSLPIGMRLSILISFVFFIVAFFCPSVLMHIFTNDPSLFEPGETYLRVVSFSYLFMSISQVYLCTMRTIERVIFATAVNGTALILNIILNAVFIFELFGVPKMGIAALALATTITRFIELGLCMADALRFKALRFRPITIFQHNRLLFIFSDHRYIPGRRRFLMGLYL